MPSGYRNKNTKVRYAYVADPHDPSGETRARTETGASSFVVKTENLEYAPLAQIGSVSDESELLARLKEAGNNVHSEPPTVEEIVRRDAHNGADPDVLDYIAIARNLPFNLGEAVRHIWLAVQGDNAEATKLDHLRQARFHLADEMQLSD